MKKKMKFDVNHSSPNERWAVAIERIVGFYLYSLSLFLFLTHKRMRVNINLQIILINTRFWVNSRVWLSICYTIIKNGWKTTRNEQLPLLEPFCHFMYHEYFRLIFIIQNICETKCQKSYSDTFRPSRTGNKRFWSMSCCCCSVTCCVAARCVKYG